MDAWKTTTVVPSKSETVYANPVNDVCWCVGACVFMVCGTILLLRVIAAGAEGGE